MKNLILLSIALLVSTTAFADQCAYITKKQAQVAVSKLALSNSIIELCEPCGEITPVKKEITSLGYAHTGYENYFEVKVNGKGIDLAYTYTNLGINMALLSACKATDVSAVINVNNL